MRNEEIKAPGNLPIARQHAALTKIITDEPETGTWLNPKYAEQEIGRELRNMENREAHGSDGIPGESYKETGKWEIAPIAKIMNKIKEGEKYRETGTMAT